nr:MAG TPA: hypothetical protein [Caudoviricetes sp.]
MIKILKSFEDSLTAQEFNDIITKELKAVNLNPAGVYISFRTYPVNEVDKTYDIPTEIIDSGLNTIVFDTNNNIVIVYTAVKDVKDYVSYNINEEGDKSIETNSLDLLSKKEDELNNITVLENDTDNSIILGNENYPINIKGSEESLNYNDKKLMNEEEVNTLDTQVKNELTQQLTQQLSLKTNQTDFDALVKRVEALEAKP